MNKNLSTVIFFFLVYAFAYTQVGVGTIAPNASLDIVSSSAIAPTNKDGILIPRINNFPTTNPTAVQDGMLVFITGNGTPAKGFYYWDQPTLSWVSVGGNSVVKKINDLLDGKSDPNGSSVFLGVNAGLNDDGTNNQNVGVGFQSLRSNTSGFGNTANGVNALSSNTTGNYNTANGTSSLLSNTTGSSNTANGVFALSSNTTGSYNTANGLQSLFANTTGSSNTANGVNALSSNTTGISNTANGVSALYSNTTGNYNTANGVLALYRNTTGSSNTANGVNALSSNTTGISNTANGVNALSLNTTGSYNTGTGYRTLFNNSGSNNTANGFEALFSNTVGYDNSAIGFQSLFYNTTGQANVANGTHALLKNTIGYLNTAIGYQSLTNNTTGNNNIAIGAYALSINSGGSFNTSVGANSLPENTTGYYNTAIGYNAGRPSLFGALLFTNATAIGSNVVLSASNQVRVGSTAVTSIGGFTNWTNVSDKRFKKDIQENVKGLDFILKLRPVTYHLDLNKIDNYLKTPDSLRFGKNNVLLKYRQQKEKEVQTGFIAQEVEKAAKDLGYDFSGVDKPKNSNDYYGLRYAEFVVPLVKSVQEQQEMIKGLKEENKLLEIKLEQQKKRIDQLYRLLKRK